MADAKTKAWKIRIRLKAYDHRNRPKAPSKLPIPLSVLVPPFLAQSHYQLSAVLLLWWNHLTFIRPVVKLSKWRLICSSTSPMLPQRPLMHFKICLCQLVSTLKSKCNKKLKIPVLTRFFDVFSIPFVLKLNKCILKEKRKRYFTYLSLS